jgi:hypothetical protein
MHQSTGSMHTWCKRVLLNHAPARGACTGSMLSKNRPYYNINNRVPQPRRPPAAPAGRIRLPSHRAHSLLILCTASVYIHALVDRAPPRSRVYQPHDARCCWAAPRGAGACSGARLRPRVAAPTLPLRQQARRPWQLRRECGETLCPKVASSLRLPDILVPAAAGC